MITKYLLSKFIKTLVNGLFVYNFLYLFSSTKCAHFAFFFFISILDRF